MGHERSPRRVAGLILAGGAGSRLAKDKGWRTVAGTPIIARVLQALAPVVDEIVIVGDCDVPAGWQVRLLPDEHPGAGPLAALATGMRGAAAEAYVTVAWDMPFLNTDLLRHMLAVNTGYDAVVPHVAGRAQPLCAVYGATCLGAIEETLAEGRRSVQAFYPLVRVLRLTEEDLRPFGDPQRLFFNVNTPEDLALAEQHARVG